MQRRAASHEYGVKLREDSLKIQKNL